MWPPLSALQVKLAEPGCSCKKVCQEEQLICEPSFFQHLNKDKDLARLVCAHIVHLNMHFAFYPTGGSIAYIYIQYLSAAVLNLYH